MARIRHASLMLRWAFCFIALVCVFSANFQPAFAQAVVKRNIVWVSPTVAPHRVKGYQVKEATAPNGALTTYIRKDGGRKWTPFYVRERYLVVTPGNRKPVVLINDCPGTKFCKVVVASLISHTVRQIDSPAVEMYRRDGHPDKRLIITPQAYAFSPNDREALINMELIYISVPADPRELANSLNKTYKNWWYVVDSTTGRVLREYRSNRIPQRWWTP